MSQYSFPFSPGGLQVSIAQALIEAQQPFGEPIPTHFQEWFSGDALDSIWTFDAISSGTSAMLDSIDGGFGITTGTTVGGGGNINFNNIRHYSEIGCGCMITHRVSSVSNFFQLVGMFGDSTAITLNRIMCKQDTALDTNINLTTTDASSSTDVSTGVTQSTNPHDSVLEALSSHATLHLDGDFGALSTTNLPTIKLQPFCRMGTRNTTSKVGEVVYLEAWNNEV